MPFTRTRRIGATAKRKTQNRMEGVAEVRSLCTVGPDASRGKMIVVATFRAALCCRHARLFADAVDWDSEIWFVERDETGKVFSERLLESVTNDHVKRAEQRRRVAEVEAVIFEAEEELKRLKRAKF